MLAIEGRIQQRRDHDHQPGDHGYRHHANSWRNDHIAWMREMGWGMKQLLQALGKLVVVGAP